MFIHLCINLLNFSKHQSPCSSEEGWVFPHTGSCYRPLNCALKMSPVTSGLLPLYGELRAVSLWAAGHRWSLFYLSISFVQLKRGPFRFNERHILSISHYPVSSMFKKWNVMRKFLHMHTHRKWSCLWRESYRKAHIFTQIVAAGGFEALKTYTSPLLCNVCE